MRPWKSNVTSPNFLTIFLRNARVASKTPFTVGDAIFSVKPSHSILSPTCTRGTGKFSSSGVICLSRGISASLNITIAYLTKLLGSQCSRRKSSLAFVRGGEFATTLWCIKLGSLSKGFWKFLGTQILCQSTGHCKELFLFRVFLVFFTTVSGLRHLLSPYFCGFLTSPSLHSLS